MRGGSSGRSPGLRFLALLWLGLFFAAFRAPAELPRAPGGGRVETLAGSAELGDGGKTIEASLTGVEGLAATPEGDLYFSDSGHGRVRRIAVATGTVASLNVPRRPAAERAGGSVGLRTPGALVLVPKGASEVGAGGGILFVADHDDASLWELDPSSGESRRVPPPEGSFGAVSAAAWTPTGLVVADDVRGQLWKRTHGVWIGLLTEPEPFRVSAGGLVRGPKGHLYLSDAAGHRVIAFDTNSGRLEVVLGTGRAGRGGEGGRARATAVDRPAGLAVDGEGRLLVADRGNRRILAVERGDRVVELHRSTAPAGSVLDWAPGALAIDGAGNLWLSDVLGDRILRFAPGATQPDVIAGGGGIGDGGPAGRAQLARPGGVVVDVWGNVFIADTLHHRVRGIDPVSGEIHTVVGTGSPGFDGDGRPGRETSLHHPEQLEIDDEGRLYIADRGNHRVRVYDPASDRVSTLAGDGRAASTGDGGPASEASVLAPRGLLLDGDTLVVASGASPELRRIDLLSGRIWNVPTGEGGLAAERGIVGLGRWNSQLVVAIPTPASVNLLTRTGKRTRLFGPPQVGEPCGVAVSADQRLYLCDGAMLLRWDGERLEVVAEGLDGARALAFDPEGRLLVADARRNRVLRIELQRPKDLRRAGLPPAAFRPGEGAPTAEVVP